MQASASVTWLSPTKIKDFVRCPASTHIKKPSTPEMRAGTIRHRIIRAYYLEDLRLDSEASVLAYASRLKLWPTISPEQQHDVVMTVLEAARKPGFLAPIDYVISCEADGLPSKNAYRFFDRESEEERELFAILLEPDLGLRGAWDLCYTEPEDATRLVIPDWKGRTQEDEEVAAASYAVAGWKMFPGFKSYEFQTRHLGTGSIVPYGYRACDLPDIERYLVGLMRKYLASPRTEERLNRWCGSCPRNSECETYLKHTGTPIAPSSKDAKKLPVPDDAVELIREFEQVSLTRLVAEAREEQLKERVKKRLSEGPVTVDGVERYLGEQGGQKELLESSAADFCDTFDIPIPAVTGIRRDLFEQAVGEKSTSIPPEIKDDFAAGLEACYAQKMNKVIKTRKAGA